MAEELWQTEWMYEPEVVAQIEFDEWPPHDD
jgi:hypothetical protein